MREPKRGWYIIRRMTGGSTEVYGGPYPTRAVARLAYYDLAVPSYGCEIIFWTATAIKHHKPLLSYIPQETL